MKITASSLSGIGMPFAGFGTYQLTADQAEFCVKEALNAGFRHIDSAEAYNNEEGTGRGIKTAGIPREKIFITTKVFPGYRQWDIPDKNGVQTIETLKNQLRKLELDYVDLYLIHAPLSELRLEQWQALTELKKSGLTKHIGVSNFGIEQINEILNAGLEKPEANQIEFHPLCNRSGLTDYMRNKSISPVAYSPLAPLSGWRIEEGQGGNVLTETRKPSRSVIRETAAELHVSEAAMLLRWGIQHGYSVITKSSKPERIRENLKAYDFEIPESCMKRLDMLNRNQPIAWAASGINPMDAAPPVSIP
ncbi:MAG: aldo/keto reductase [Spirochaetes bacterium]|nr:aldo/keto reductase [Spirochaetota bacterium]